MSKIVLFLILITYPLFATDIIREFLNSKEIEKLQSENFNDSLFKKIRLNLNRSNFKEEPKNDYEARIYPKSFKEMEIEKKIYNLKKDEFNNFKIENISEVSRDRYLLVIEMYFKKLENTLSKEILELYKKKLNITSKNLESISKVFDIAKLKEEVDKLIFNSKKQKSNYDDMIFYIKSNLPKYNTTQINEAIDKLKFIDISEILNYIKIDSTSNSNLLIDEKNAIELAKYEKRLKEVQESFRINSIDIKYEDDKKSDFSIGVSLEFPLSKSDNLKEKLNILKAKSNFELKKEKLNYQIFKLSKEIKRVSEEFFYYEEKLKDDTFYNKYLKLQNPNPFIIVDLKINHLKIKERVLELKKSLYIKSINLFNIKNELEKILIDKES